MVYCFEITTTEKFLGIYLDHVKARLVEYRGGRTVYENLNSGLYTEDKKNSQLQGSIPEKKKTELLHNYYQALITKMKKYSRVVLFGPGDAKVELNQRALSLLDMNSIDVNVSKENSLSDQQIDLFVREYFEQLPVLAH